MLKNCEHHDDAIKPNVKSGENFSCQCDKTFWREATKRKPAHKESISPESINRESSLWKIIFIDDSFLISLCLLSRTAYPKTRRNRILDIHSFQHVISAGKHFNFLLYSTLNKLNHHDDKKNTKCQKYKISHKEYEMF